jgi:predicted phosphohydrolase
MARIFIRLESPERESCFYAIFLVNFSILKESSGPFVSECLRCPIKQIQEEGRVSEVVMGHLEQ